MFAFFQSSGPSLHHHSLSKWPQSDVTQLPHCPWVYPFSSLLKVVPMSVCSTEGVHSLLSGFPLASETRSSWRLLFRVLQHWVLAPFGHGSMFSLIFLLLQTYLQKPLLLHFTSLATYLIPHGFWFPYPFSACLDNTSIFPLNHLPFSPLTALLHGLSYFWIFKNH